METVASLLFVWFYAQLSCFESQTCATVFGHPLAGWKYVCTTHCGEAKSEPVARRNQKMMETEVNKFKKILETELEQIVRNRDGIVIEKSADALDEVRAAER